MVGQRLGLTLVETLIVITVIGLLVAILIPAVQMVRESARRSQCSTNLKQLSLALHNYHSAHRVFPPSIMFDEGDYPDGPEKYRKNWVVSILPFLEEQGLYDQFNFKHPLNAVANEVPRGTELVVMLCPSETNSGSKFGKHPGHFQGTHWARGNYGANACLGNCYWFPKPEATTDYAYRVRACGGPDQAFWRSSSRWNAGYSRGVMGANASLSVSDISDGTSNSTFSSCSQRQFSHWL